MKTLAKILSVLFFLLMMSSCSHRSSGNVREWTVKLKDSIGIVHITLPLVYDTMHSWKCESDDAPDDEYYYRIQSSKSSMKEEGCFIRRVPDTINSFTIGHLVLFEGKHVDSFDIHKYLEKQTEFFSRMVPDQRIDTASFTISGLNYSMIYRQYKTYSEKMILNELSFRTIFNHRRIALTFEKTSVGMKDSTFIKESIEAIKTVQFEKYK